MADEPIQEQPVVVTPPAAQEQQPVAAPSPPEQQPVAAEAVVEAAVEKPATVSETPSLLEQAAAPDGTSGVAVEEKPAEAEKPAEGEKPAEVKADAPKTEDVKPVEGEKPVEVKTEEPKTEEKPALQPVEYKYELPPNVALPDEQRTVLHGLLDGFRTDPSNVQPLVDFHVAEVNRLQEQMGQQQHDVFNDTRATWRKEIQADEEMGGSGMDTTIRAVARMRDLLVSSHKQGTPEYDRDAKAANEFFRITGAGDHPVLWRMLHNAARFMDEATPLPTDIKPAANGRQQGSRRGLLYNHPSSPGNKDG